MLKRSVMACAALWALALPAWAHELWIDPIDYAVGVGTPMQAHIRVGQMLEGSAHSFVPLNFTRFDITQGAAVVPVEGRPGDRPALNMSAPQEGLAVISYVTRDLTLVYTDLSKFEAFARHKDFLWVMEDHKARKLSTRKFTER